MLSSKFEPKHKRIVISLQCQNLNRKSNESAWQWMGRPPNKGGRMQIYKESNRLLREKIINGLDDEGRINTIFSEVSTLKNMEAAKSERVLLWAQKLKVHRAHK